MEVPKSMIRKKSKEDEQTLAKGHVYRPHCVRSVHTTSVKILPYRPPAWLIISSY